MPEPLEQSDHDMAHRDSDLLYNSLAEILSAQRPIEQPEEAFNCASTLSDVLHFMSMATSKMELSRKDRNAIGEILGAVEVVAWKLMEWEKRNVGLEQLNGAEIKYMRRAPKTKG